MIVKILQRPRSAGSRGALTGFDHSASYDLKVIQLAQAAVTAEPQPMPCIYISIVTEHCLQMS
ncbi:MAG TPA: hypothetical protein VIQ29_01425, partial [Ancylobacter sp.]